MPAGFMIDPALLQQMNSSLAPRQYDLYSSPLNSRPTSFSESLFSAGNRGFGLGPDSLGPGLGEMTRGSRLFNEGGANSRFFEESLKPENYSKGHLQEFDLFGKGRGRWFTEQEARDELTRDKFRNLLVPGEKENLNLFQKRYYENNPFTEDIWDTKFGKSKLMQTLDKYGGEAEFGLKALLGLMTGGLAGGAMSAAKNLKELKTDRKIQKGELSVSGKELPGGSIDDMTDEQAGGILSKIASSMKKFNTSRDYDPLKQGDQSLTESAGKYGTWLKNVLKVAGPLFMALGG